METRPGNASLFVVRGCFPGGALGKRADADFWSYTDAALPSLS